MESMDNFRERFEALEQQMKAMGAHTRTVDMARTLFVFDLQNHYIRVETSRDSRYQNMWVGIAEALQSTKDAKPHGPRLARASHKHGRCLCSCFATQGVLC